ncbi:MAG: hypothetical protein UY36_C0020G0002 [Parcubacteria group bacterium GW2011_GWA1_49_11]|nr:MAG: hypothetical protein UY36_C0020G0002 [Parcubacteria group bacterium GW2011_GWA1_49_11]
MDNRFRNVTVLIWDFDGTLYAPNPALWKEIREGEYRTIMAHTGWPREQAVAEFEKLHKTVYPSRATKNLSHFLQNLNSIVTLRLPTALSQITKKHLTSLACRPKHLKKW